MGRQKAGWPIAFFVFGFLIVIGSLFFFACLPRRAVKIGVIASFTGATSFLSDEVRAGIEYQRELFGAEKSAPRIQLVYRDDKASPEYAASLVGELAASGCLAIIGPVTSGIGIAVAEAASTAKIAVLSPTVSVGSLSGKDDYFFRLYPAAEELGRYLGSFAASEGIKSLAVAGDLSNAQFAQEWERGFGDALRSKGGKVISSLSSQAGPAFSPDSIAAGLRAASPQAVLLVYSATHASALLTALPAGTSRPKVYSSTWAFTSYGELVSYAGASAEGVCSIVLFDPASPAAPWRALDSSLRESRGVEASPASALGAESLLAVVAAYRAGGRDRESLKTHLSGLRFEGLQGPVSLDGNGDVSRPVYEAAVTGGRVTVKASKP